MGRDEAAELTFWANDGSRLARIGRRHYDVFPVRTPETTEIVDGRAYPGVASYPAGRSLTRSGEPVDAVYTWVDGADPAWRAAYEHWSSVDLADGADTASAHPSLYASRQELRYSLRSLWLNAGWIRRVFIVTAGQVPHWLVESERVRIVDHSEILPSDGLPTFNSFAIETRLHHISDLAECFVYFNDDFFLGRSVPSSAFFTPNGLPKVVESTVRIPAPRSGRRPSAFDTTAWNGQALIREMFGRTYERFIAHAPYALRRSLLFEIEDRVPEVGRTVRSRFRHARDVSLAADLAHRFALCTGHAVQGTLSVGYQTIQKRTLPFFLGRLLVERDLDAFCLNDSDLESADASYVGERLEAFYESYFPVASAWEA